jgi:hypothetical protein
MRPEMPFESCFDSRASSNPKALAQPFPKCGLDLLSNPSWTLKPAHRAQLGDQFSAAHTVARVDEYQQPKNQLGGEKDQKYDERRR